MGRARPRGIAVVFHLHNLGHREPKVSDSKKDRRAFVDVSAVIFPSEYSRRHHARLLGLDGPVIPDPIPLDRIFATDPEPKYVTFINPAALQKGRRFSHGLPRRCTAGDPTFLFLIGLMPQFNAASDLENRKKDLTPRSPGAGATARGCRGVFICTTSATANRR